MARGTTLANLRLFLRAEIGQTTNTSAATQSDAALNYMLSNKQKLLCTMYDFPFLEERWDVPVGLNTHFIAMPSTTVDGDSATVNIERPLRMHVFFDNYYNELDYGIGADEYNHRNSYATPPEVEDPVQRWRFADDVPVADTNQQIELWPVPASSQVIRLTGQRKLLTLAADSDTCDLDDMLLIYMVASDLLLRQEYVEEAKSKMAMANQRLLQIKATYPCREERLVLGREKNLSRAARRTVPLVLVR